MTAAMTPEDLHFEQFAEMVRTKDWSQLDAWLASLSDDELDEYLTAFRAEQARRAAAGEA